MENKKNKNVFRCILKENFLNLKLKLYMKGYTYIQGKIDTEQPKHTGKIIVFLDMKKNTTVNEEK